jgi:hypothetical protein
MKKNLMLTLSLMLALFVTASGWAQTNAFIVNGPTLEPRTDTWGSAGFTFNGNTSGTAKINLLGFYDSGGDGLAVSHDVALLQYNGRNYTVLAKVTVPAGTAAPLDNGYRWVSIPELTLTDTSQTLDSYCLVASMGTDTWYGGTNDADLTASAPFGTLTGRGTAHDVAIPSVGSVYNPGLLGTVAYGGPNMGFAAIPEPSTFALVGLALVPLFLRRRQN